MQTALIKRIRNIPTLPSILAKIIETLDDQDSSASDLELIVVNDQSLTTKLLAVSNSAYYGFRHQITTVRRAVVAIGYDEVRNICLGLSLMGFLHPSTFRDKDAAEQLWLHSLAAAKACAILAESTKICDKGLAFTSGLLHDIGKVVLGAFMPEEMSELQKLMGDRGLSYREAETELDLSHEEVGMALAELWDLPPVIVEVLGRHHNPQPALAYYPAVAMVNAADVLVHRASIGCSGDPDQTELSPETLEGLNTPQDVLEAAARELDRRREEIERYWRQLISPSSAGSES